MLDTIDLNASIEESEYYAVLPNYQRAMRALQEQACRRKRPIVIVLEGWDASGKGSTLRRLTEALDPASYTVHPIGLPRGEEAEQHYLRRFWESLPAAGRLAIFDHSWYSRVLVERVEGLCTISEWKRAYREINQFEQQLIDFGTVLFKFWLHISKDEQLSRFQARQADKLRRWKLSANDWRNREKWDLYAEAVNDMLFKTNTAPAPWTLVPANDKRYARICVFNTLTTQLGKALNFDPFAKIKPHKEGKIKRSKKKKKLR